MPDVVVDTERFVDHNDTGPWTGPVGFGEVSPSSGVVTPFGMVTLMAARWEQA